MAVARPRVWVSQPLFDDIVDQLAAHCDVDAAAQVVQYDATAIAAALRDADGALVTLNERIGATELAAAPRLRAIANVGVGYNNLDIAALDAAGVVATNTPDVLTDDVADIAAALVLMTSRRLTQANRLLHADRWSEGTSTLTTKVGGKRAGIVGLGRIGKGIAQRLEAFGMTIGYTGRNAQSVPYAFYASVTELAAWSDFLIVACPGGPGTKHLINADVLRALGANGTLINIARGSIVDEAALITALRDGVIKCAGLDVFENEPHVPAELSAMEHVTLLPHVGSATRETRGEMARLVLENLVAHFAGQPLVTPVI